MVLLPSDLAIFSMIRKVIPEVSGKNKVIDHLLMSEDAKSFRVEVIPPERGHFKKWVANRLSPAAHEDENSSEEAK